MSISELNGHKILRLGLRKRTDLTLGERHVGLEMNEMELGRRCRQRQSGLCRLSLYQPLRGLARAPPARGAAACVPEMAEAEPAGRCLPSDEGASRDPAVPGTEHVSVHSTQKESTWKPTPNLLKSPPSGGRPTSRGITWLVQEAVDEPGTFRAECAGRGCHWSGDTVATGR